MRSRDQMMPILWGDPDFRVASFVEVLDLFWLQTLSNLLLRMIEKSIVLLTESLLPRLGFNILKIPTRGLNTFNHRNELESLIVLRLETA